MRSLEKPRSEAECYVAVSFAKYSESLPTLRASGGDLGGGSEGILVIHSPLTEATAPSIGKAMSAQHSHSDITMETAGMER